MGTLNFERLEIEGNLVSVVESKVTKQVLLDEFIKTISAQQPLTSGYVPKDCCYLERRITANGSRTLYIIEWAPQCVSIKYRGVDVNDTPDKDWTREKREFLLSWPGVLWFVVGTSSQGAEIINRTFMAATHRPFYLKELDTEIYRIPMPNQHDAQRGPMCTGHVVVPEKGSLGFKVHELVKMLGLSEWNSDLHPRYADYGIESIKDWHARTAANPEAWRELKWTSHVTPTVRGMIEHVFNYR